MTIIDMGMNSVLWALLALNVIIMIVLAFMITNKNQWVKSVDFTLKHLTNYIDGQESINKGFMEHMEGSIKRTQLQQNINAAQDKINDIVVDVIKERTLR